MFSVKISFLFYLDLSHLCNIDEQLGVLVINEFVRIKFSPCDDSHIQSNSAVTAPVSFS